MLAIVMKWLPWSGKSTRASQQEWFLIISKDIIRKENPSMKEGDVYQTQKDQITQAAKDGKDIIVDNTHMNVKTLNETLSFCTNLWYDTVVKDMIEEIEATEEWKYNEYHTICTKRNKERERKVPQSVIDEMYLANYQEKLNYYIFDIDWTLARMNPKRREALDNKDYDTFYWPLVLEDEPIVETLRVLNHLEDDWSFQIIIVSWRSNACCELTQQWLAKYCRHRFILMRQSRDNRQDWMVKKDIYEKCLANQPWRCLWVFDDREQVMKMRRDKGLFVFDCSQGNRDF